jgi:glucose-6-phosphate-specific signal transduction histidine kinase
MQVLTLAALVGLITGGLAISNMASSFFTTGTASTFEVVILSLLAELTSIFTVWIAAAWSLLALSSYVVGLQSIRSMIPTTSMLWQTGSSKQTYRTLILLRLLLLVTLSWLFGWTGGLAASQIAYRLAAYVISAPYAIPYLQLMDLLKLLALTFTAVFAGGLYFVIKTRRFDSAGA